MQLSCLWQWCVCLQGYESYAVRCRWTSSVSWQLVISVIIYNNFLFQVLLLDINCLCQSENDFTPVCLSVCLQKFGRSRNKIRLRCLSRLDLWTIKNVPLCCYLSHCYTIAWDRLSNQFFLSVCVCVCVCVCVSVCLSVCLYVCMCLWALLRSHFSTNLHEIW